MQLWIDKLFWWLVGILCFIGYQLKMLKHRPRLWWNALWIRKDEFHMSLSMDVDAMLDMNEQDSAKYSKDLVMRRIKAHERDIKCHS